jgi:hypothetical protein
LCRTRTITKTSSRSRSLDQSSRTVDHMDIVGGVSLCMAMTILSRLLPFNFHLVVIVVGKKGSCSCSVPSMGMIFLWLSQHIFNVSAALWLVKRKVGNGISTSTSQRRFRVVQVCVCFRTTLPTLL